jgi:bacterioferritin-associated ferredoxin
VETGVVTMPQLRERLQVGTCCGKCHPHAKQVLRECVAEKQAAETREPVFPIIFQLSRMAA